MQRQNGIFYCGVDGVRAGGENEIENNVTTFWLSSASRSTRDRDRLHIVSKISTMRREREKERLSVERNETRVCVVWCGRAREREIESEKSSRRFEYIKINQIRCVLVSITSVPFVRFSHFHRHLLSTARCKWESFCINKTE